MHAMKIILLSLSLLVLGSGCQHGASLSLETQKKFFASLKDSNPETERVLRCAQYYNLVGRFDLALKELTGAVTRDPENVRLLNAMGSCYDRQGDYTRAQEMYAKILAQEAGHIPAKNNLGYSYFLAGNLARAETIFQEILAQDPKNVVAQNNLGLVWCQQGKDSQALSLWQKTEGELAARDKVQQVLAYLGKSGEKAVSSPPLAKETTPLVSGTQKGLANKPENLGPPPTLARSEKIPAARQPSVQVAAEPKPTPVSPVTSSRTPAKLPQEANVKVEEVKMIIQPASFSPPPAIMNQAAGEEIPTVVPTSSSPGKSTPGLTNPAKAKTVISDADLDQIETEPPRRYYRSRQWKRYWKPRMVIYAPQEPQKPVKPMKDIINTGQIHRNGSGGSEAAIY